MHKTECATVASQRKRDRSGTNLSSIREAGPEAIVATFDVRLDGATQRVRLILVDTPEVFGGTDCFGPEASAFTKRTLPVGTLVSLEKDVSETDRCGRLLRYVHLGDGRMFNEILVAEGYAQVATLPPDLKHQERLLAAHAPRGMHAQASGRPAEPLRPRHR